MPAISAAILAARDSLAMQSSDPVQCVPSNITWQGGLPPFTLNVTSVVNKAVGDTLFSFPGITDQSFQWPVNLVEGTNIGYVLSDAENLSIQEVPILIQPSSDKSCLSASSSSASVSATSSSASASSTSATTQTTGTAAAPPSASEAASSSTPSPAPAQPSTSNGTTIGIAIGAALGGIALAALVFYMCWRRAARRRQGVRALDLNDSEPLPPFEPPAVTKAAEAQQSLMHTRSHSQSSFTSSAANSAPPYAYGRQQQQQLVTVPNAYAGDMYIPRPYPASPGGSSVSGYAPGPGSVSVSNSGYGFSGGNMAGLGVGVGVGVLGAGAQSERSTKAAEARALAVQNPEGGPSVVQESDAGVRLAGGSSGPDVAAASVPPPYRMYDE